MPVTYDYWYAFRRHNKRYVFCDTEIYRGAVRMYVSHAPNIRLPYKARSHSVLIILCTYREFICLDFFQTVNLNIKTNLYALNKNAVFICIAMPFWAFTTS